MMDPRKMNLKTLKDIEEELEFGFNFGIERMLILKKEAIKWVKWEKEYHNEFRDARADILIEFFNITEEDLK